MREYGKLKASFFDWALEHGLSDQAMVLGIYLAICPSGNLMGRFFLPVKEACYHLRWSEQKYFAVMQECTDVLMVDYDAENEAIRVLNTGWWCKPVPEEICNPCRRPGWADWNALRNAVFSRDNYACQYCGQHTDAPECDHVIPRSRGGLNVLSNLVTACLFCNRSKGSKTVEEWRGAV